MDATVTDLYIGDKAKEEGKYPAECEERACNVFTDDRSMLLIDFCQIFGSIASRKLFRLFSQLLYAMPTPSPAPMYIGHFLYPRRKNPPNMLPIISPVTGNKT
ncbi:jg27872 [Pararge aegeria aegeria]|uniref:Jg27872 protein n=1 Tax=Pararge aegeria aegeria TaxID=348720 RepID=A0A8S4RZZ8_9NEOP|nr:jg27872 [Pararge aegeria aegeria]